jgi:hypothetical protein
MGSAHEGRLDLDPDEERGKMKENAAKRQIVRHKKVFKTIPFV